MSNLLPKGARRRAFVFAAMLFSALISAGLASSRDEGASRPETSSKTLSAVKLSPVHWPAIRRNWIGQIETDATRTWIATIVPVPLSDGNLFKLDPVSLAVRKIRVAVPFAQLFAGDGQLWGLPDDGKSLVSVDPSTGVLESHKLSAACGLPPDVAGVVALGQLWLSCRGVVAAYKPKRDRIERSSAPRASTVLASTRGVWLLARRSLVGVAGDAKGRQIALPQANNLLGWQTEGNEAWARDSLNGKALIRVDLASGAVRRFALETHAQRIDTFAVAPDDIWVTVADPANLKTKPLLLRFDRIHPRRPLSRLDLSDGTHPNDLQITLRTGPSYLWVELFSNRQSRLFRATVRK